MSGLVRRMMNQKMMVPSMIMATISNAATMISIDLAFLSESEHGTLSAKNPPASATMSRVAKTTIQTVWRTVGEALWVRRCV